MTTVVIAHVCATWFMVGLIWMVQSVHYPLFAVVGRSSQRTYAAEHTLRIARLLALPAGVEVVTAVLLIWVRPTGTATWLVLISGALLGALWLTTLLVQVPIHQRLSRSWSAPVIERLVKTNWLRTAGWSLRGLLVLVILVQVG